MKKIICLLAVVCCLLGTAYASPNEGKQIVPSDVGCSISDYSNAVVSDCATIDNLTYEVSNIFVAMPKFSTMSDVVTIYAAPPYSAALVTHSYNVQSYLCYSDSRYLSATRPANDDVRCMRCYSPVIDYTCTAPVVTMRSNTNVTHAEYVKRE
jgi:hypothetical protein